MRSPRVAPSRSALVLRVAAAAALSLGYLDLIRGGITVAPVLIVIGYVILVPGVILSWR